MGIIDTNLNALTIGEGVSFGSLTMIPLLFSTQTEPSYLTLDDALKSKLCRVKEVSEGGAVPELRFENIGNRPVFLLDGEELIGAKQNRIINLSILAPADAALDIPVSCVEQGRWRYNGREFDTSPRAQYAASRAKKARSVSRSMKYERNYRSDQSEVWDEISAKAERMSVASETDSMSDIYEASQSELDKCVKALPPKPTQVGAVFFIGDQIAGVDIFGSDKVLRKLLPKLVRSYALDAIEIKTELRTKTGSKRAKAFLDLLAEGATAEQPALGLGVDYRFEGEVVAGGALMVEEGLIHLAAFPVTDGGLDGSVSRRFRHGPDEPLASFE